MNKKNNKCKNEKENKYTGAKDSGDKLRFIHRHRRDKKSGFNENKFKPDKENKRADEYMLPNNDVSDVTGLSLIDVRNVRKSYEGKDVFREVTIHVNEGEIVSILGISGIGKTTLFNLISGLEEPDEGTIKGMSTGGYMLQKDLLMPWKTLEDNIALPLILKGIDKSKALKTVRSYLKDFGLEGSEKLLPGALSGGMKQRAALLRTHLASEGVLLLDEPFSSVDAMVKYKLQQWILDLTDKIQMTILLITHDVREAIFLSDRIYLMTGNPATISRELVLTDKGMQSSAKGDVIDKNIAEKFIFDILETELDRIS